MRFLFIARHVGYFRNYDSALRMLADRGHEIHFAVERHDAIGRLPAVETLARECPNISFGTVPDRGNEQWDDMSRRLRLGLDYLRYLDAFYDVAPLRRVRARERTPAALRALADPPLVRGPWWRKRVGAWLHALDLAIPPPRAVVEYLESQRPDALLITPLVDLGSQQIDFVRAARQLGIPTALAVFSWDHLSSKAFLREYPERVLVWNGTQRREAIEVHGVPADRVVVTGAQCFDHWFDRRPSRTRDELCRPLGLPADRAIVLYVCTGLIAGSPPEPPFVREWLERLRASDDPRVAAAAVLVRPHPVETAAWKGVDLSRWGPVAIWGGNPIDEESRADYFDSLYHSAAVVGLNTSAFLEAGIVGREVLAILPPQFHDNQEGTVHFRYLLEIGGGLLRVSRDFETHLRQLGEALARPETREHPHRAFLESFVRPRGLHVAATPVFVEAAEGLPACATAAGDRASADPSWRRALLQQLHALAARPAFESWVLSPRELESLQRSRAASLLKAAHRDDAVRTKEARRQQREAAHARYRVAEAAEREARFHQKMRRQAEKRATADARRARARRRDMRLRLRRSAAELYRRLFGAGPGAAESR